MKLVFYSLEFIITLGNTHEYLTPMNYFKVILGVISILFKLYYNEGDKRRQIETIKRSKMLFYGFEYFLCSFLDFSNALHVNFIMR